jgi:hypothetical protein
VEEEPYELNYWWWQLLAEPAAGANRRLWRKGGTGRTHDGLPGRAIPLAPPAACLLAVTQGTRDTHPETQEAPESPLRDHRLP